jgi:hypothetical protein
MFYADQLYFFRLDRGVYCGSAPMPNECVGSTCAEMGQIFATKNGGRGQGEHPWMMSWRPPKHTGQEHCSLVLSMWLAMLDICLCACFSQRSSSRYRSIFLLLSCAFHQSHSKLKKFQGNVLAHEKDCSDIHKQIHSFLYFG